MLYLLETLSVREVSESDNKYSAVVSAPYPVNMLNMSLGVFVLTVKSPFFNKILLHIYFIPTMLTCLGLFILYQAIILPFAYVKLFFHKFALVIKNPTGIGAKTRSNRFSYAILFMFAGPFILLINAFVDIFWFLRHLYM